MSAPRRHRPLSRLLRDEDGSIAIEFAFILPVLLIMLLGTFEVSKYIQTNNQVVQTVGMVGQMISQLPATAKIADAQRIWSAAPLIAPEAQRVASKRRLGAWSDVLTVTMTSIVFTQRDAACKSDCVYDANVAWSVGQTLVACGKIPSGSPLLPLKDVIPAELYGPGSVLLVRATLPYEPYLAGTASFLSGLGRALTTTMSESSWFLPRNTGSIVLSAPGAASPNFKLCPGVNP